MVFLLIGIPILIYSVITAWLFSYLKRNTAILWGVAFSIMHFIVNVFLIISPHSTGGFWLIDFSEVFLIGINWPISFVLYHSQTGMNHWMLALAGALQMFLVGFILNKLLLASARET